MTMLYGFASKRESFPLGYVSEAIDVGVKSLHRDNRKQIVQGSGGTVMGISFAVDKNTSTSVLESRPAHQMLPQKIGNRITLKSTNSLGLIEWITLRGRVAEPEVLHEALELFDLNNLLVRGALAIVTSRDKIIPYEKVDSSAPIETLPGFSSGTVGQITLMINQLKKLKLQAGPMDGRQVSRKINASIPHSHGDVSTSAMAERLYLQKYFAVLPFALHWILVDQSLEFVHALHSQEPAGINRKIPYLSLAQNAKRSIIFASKSEMISHHFPEVEIEAPPSGQVYTRFTQ